MTTVARGALTTSLFRRYGHVESEAQGEAKMNISTIHRETCLDALIAADSRIVLEPVEKRTVDVGALLDWIDANRSAKSVEQVVALWLKTHNNREIARQALVAPSMARSK